MKFAGKKLWVLILLIIVISVSLIKYVKNKNADEAPKYTESIVRKGSIKVQILSTGIIQPENKVEIKAPVAGRVEKVLVNEGAKVKKGQVLAWMSSTERAAMLDAASSKGPKEVKEWEEMYRATPILAAINGTVIQKNVESGQTFTTQDAILVMSDRLTVKAQVDETDIAKIKLKQQARITLDAYPDATIDAVVDQIAYDSKTVNNVTTYIVDVLPISTPPYMRSGMTANVIFNVDSKNEIIVVPTEAIKTQDNKSIVLLKDPSTQDFTKPLEQVVETGITDGKRTEILSGLKENDVLLIPQFDSKNIKNATGSSPFSPMGARRTGGARAH